MTKERIKKTLLGTFIAIIIFGLMGVFVFSGDNFDLLKSLFIEEHTQEELQDKLTGFGVKGYITIVILSMLQIVLSFLPAEPVQVLAGLTFGFPIGLLCCTIGVLLGNTFIYIMYRLYGNGLRNYFVKNLHVDLDKAALSKKLILIIFILYFLPAIPYGMICFFASSVGMRYPRYITVTLLGSIPSVCIGVGLGHMAISASYVISIIVFAVLIILLGIVMLKKDKIFAMVNSYIDRAPYSSKTTVQSYSPLILPIANVVARIVFFFKGVKVKYVKKTIGEIAAPSIVLCNHGSFVDFAYAGTLIRRVRPHFIVARLYFYKKLVGEFLKKIGCFPKSMFAMDLESAKNCLRVLKTGKVLAMMPEARLSTVGKFEDIQDGTFHFLKKSAVPVYTIKICGDYFASPKWGDGLRRGARVEAKLEPLFTGEEVAALSVEEIKERVTERLYYDEFKWLDTRPNVRYKKKTLAEGLENILSRCPKCNAKYSIITKGHTVSCEACKGAWTIDDRYAFVGGEPFKNFCEWYEWQTEKMKEEISVSEDYALTSPVTLCMRSLDGKTMLRTVGRGVATLNRDGLTYVGKVDDRDLTLSFKMQDIYRLLFGAGENFEIYVGQEIYYFKPDERRSSVDWYIVSRVLRDRYEQ